MMNGTQDILKTINNQIKKQMGGGMRKRVPAPFVLATIDPSFVAGSGRPKVVFDDDTSRTPTGPYPYLSSYTPAANDRVQLARVGVSGKFVIQGKIV